ncbi:PREDICTED: uncharacterized protein LOC102012965 [Chinchilla lanigera]|uniref:uncharacterized protein LOC102012965 n=1 Tax=Chinchilla lanigera TaxID=34839 RepID=UPI00038F0B4A|nr:PREDICTED: uncharacterized protein LOC102012965 [Chinchilla lanigera]
MPSGTHSLVDFPLLVNLSPLSHQSFTSYCPLGRLPPDLKHSCYITSGLWTTRTPKMTQSAQGLRSGRLQMQETKELLRGSRKLSNPTVRDPRRKCVWETIYAHIAPWASPLSWLSALARRMLSEQELAKGEGEEDTAEEEEAVLCPSLPSEGEFLLVVYNKCHRVQEEGERCDQYELGIPARTTTEVSDKSKEIHRDKLIRRHQILERGSDSSRPSRELMSELEAA